MAVKSAVTLCGRDKRFYGLPAIKICDKKQAKALFKLVSMLLQLVCIESDRKSSHSVNSV